MLPIGLECSKGAIVFGNENTKSVLTSTFEKAGGQIDAGSAGPLDIYRQIFEFDFSKPVIQIRPNPDFKRSQLAAAKGMDSSPDDASETLRKRDFHWIYHHHKRKIWHSIRDLIPYFQTSVESFHRDGKTGKVPDPTATGAEGLPGEGRWLGLMRYLNEDEQDEHEGWDSVEYGRFSTIVESPSLSVNYYWDVPGKVTTATGSNSTNDINGTSPPEWGANLGIRGGTINYGPWTDRERVGLQNVFFPSPYRDSKPSVPLSPGAWRQSTAFKMRVDIEQETTLRIPTREDSKDWQWKGRAEAIKGASKRKREKEKKHPRNKKPDKGNLGPDIRPFGWFSLRVDSDSTITYLMDMVASDSGYTNQLDLDLRGTKLSSSVNHGLLWQSARQTISCDLSNTPGWNSLHHWIFNVQSDNLDLFLLRDHMFLFTDLITDWASGPPSEYYTFVPFQYTINFSFAELKLYLNVNDSNIINNPSDLDDNTFLVIKSKSLTSNVEIPLVQFRPSHNTVPFNVVAHHAEMEVITPLWHTHHSFLKDRSIATLKKMDLSGSYAYNSSTSPALTDTLSLDVVGVSPKLYIYGFIIRYFLKVKDNYAGEDLHFRTLEEYQEMLNSKDPDPKHHGGIPHPSSNDLDVMMRVRVDKPCAFLPSNIYDHWRSLRLDAACIEADLRVTNYYMDLETFLSPLEISFESRQHDGSTAVSNTQLFVDGISVYGHRLFGLPPSEPTYVCNWDFRVGRILGECSTELLRCATSNIKGFLATIDDEENALPPAQPVVLHDVTFLRVRVESVQIWVPLDQLALLLSCGTVNLAFNDWAGVQFSERLNLRVPDLTFAAVDPKSARLRGGQHHPVATYAHLKTTIDLKMVERKAEFAAERGKQQEHIRIHDQRTHRTPWLLLDQDTNTGEHHPSGKQRINPPAMPFPFMPEPMKRLRGVNYDSSSKSAKSGSRGNLSHKSSFLSFRSSNSSRPSIPRRPRTPKSAVSWAQSSHASAPLSGYSHSIRPGTTSEHGLFRRNNHARDDTRTSVMTFSSPWTTPYFPLQKLTPDAQEIPELPSFDSGKRRNSDEDDMARFSFTTDYEEATHINFSCELSTGLTGFCTPKFIHLLPSFYGDMQPNLPVDILDDLQAGVVSDILKHLELAGKPERITSFSLWAPAIRLRLLNPLPGKEGGLHERRDIYDIALSRPCLTLRTRLNIKEGDLVGQGQEKLAVHALSDSILLSAEGGSTSALDQNAIFRCRIDDFLAWMVSKPTTKAHIQSKNIEAVTSSKSVGSLAHLVERTTMMLNGAAAPFQEISAAQTKRVHSLIYSLTKLAEDTPDPLFLSRPSYVLRAAEEHLRLHDSWKIISRLRNTYNYLSNSDEEWYATQCRDNTLPYPEHAKFEVLSSFDSWRSWDLAHVDKSHVMRTIWGADDEQNLGASSTKPANVFCSIQKLQFLLDPGPKENSILVEDLTSAVTINMPEGEREPTSNGNPRNVVNVRIYSSKSAVHVNWEICELIEDVLKHVSQKPPRSNPTTQTSDEAVATKSALTQDQEYHIVIGADAGSVTLDGINLRLALLGKGLKGSFVYQCLAGASPETTSILLSSDAGSSEVTSRRKALMVWKTWYPKIYGSHHLQVDEFGTKHEWKLIAACQGIRYELKEDPLGLIEVVDRVVEDEVKYIRDLIAAVDIPKAPAQKTTLSEKYEAHQFHVVLFLDNYQMAFSLLPSLTYIISGKVARLSVMPTSASKLEVDFDLAGHSHAFWSGGREESHIISTLEMPPINGRILVDSSPNRTTLEVESTLEIISIDGSSVRGLLSAVNGSEISNFIYDLKTAGQGLKSHFHDILSPEPPTPRITAPPPQSDIIYRVRLTLAGIHIHASAPALKSKEYSAEMDLKLGLIQLRLENGSGDGPVLEYPKFHVHLRQIIFDLRKRDEQRAYSYGSLLFDAHLHGTSKFDEKGDAVRVYHLASSGLEVDLFAETASMVVDIAAYLQERIKALDLTQEMKHLRRLRLLGKRDTETPVDNAPRIEVPDDINAKNLFDAMYSVELVDIQVSWIMSTNHATSQGRNPEDLVFSIKRIDLATKRENAARLRIEDMQLQMTPDPSDKRKRSLNSALLPEVIFNVAYLSTDHERRLAFQAAGKALDIRMTSEFILPASLLQDSIASASEKLRETNALWAANPAPENRKSENLFTSKRFGSVLVDADFDGAVLSLQGKQTDDESQFRTSTKNSRIPGSGKYGQYIQGDSQATAALTAPGVAVKVQFKDNGENDPTLNAEIKVDASTNILYPAVVPLVKQISSSIKEVVGDSDARPPATETKLNPQKIVQERYLGTDDPNTILGRCKLNIGLWIGKQEFSLSCQPIARVAATARFDDIHMTVNTVQSSEHRRFFAMLISFNSLQASVKHVYSSESTANFDVKSIIISLMNSKHVSTTSGISAILKVSPMRAQLNAKQVQDLLLFREIWIPQDDMPAPATPTPQPEAQVYMVKRYQQVAAAGAFPWNSTVAIEELNVQLDLGQSLGKSAFTIGNLWLSSKKTSDSEQNLCIGFETMKIESKGRMSGFVVLRNFRVRTSIQWPDEEPESGQTPLIQASIGLDQLQAKAAFEYQPFLVADIDQFEFLMYNVRDTTGSEKDRLVSTLDGSKVQVFCTTLTASQSLALYQTWQKLLQEKQAAFELSLKEIEKFLRPKPASSVEGLGRMPSEAESEGDISGKTPISLHTHVVVTIQAVNIGAFPSTFFDNQIFKLEALKTQAQFGVSLESGKIHSALGLTLGQLRVALSSIGRSDAQGPEDISVNDVVKRATGSRGGTILKVPRLVASMETWQIPLSNNIDYIFKSSFEGKVDVGWNYARISFIRGMWMNHSRALASRLGKPPPKSAVQITGGPRPEGDGGEYDEQEKITAVVNVPQSKYGYVALEPPVIETPQLRDMGEATPPLEWIGLHRDKLPNITHQIIIVTLLEVAKEVEDAYSKILGTSSKQE